MINPLFSIVIPLYNKNTSISRAIDSVLNQTVDNFELIIVDDGSTDNSVNIVRKYTDNRIKLIQKENGGASSARNTGIKNSCGTYISFLDADDEWCVNYLEIILHLSNKYPDAGLYCTSYNYIDDTGTKFPVTCYGLCDDNEGPYLSFFKNFSKPDRYNGITVNSSNATIPRGVFEKVGYFNESATIYEDHDMWARIALYYDVVSSKERLATIHGECSEGNRRLKTLNMISLPFSEYIAKIDSKFIIMHKDYDDIALYLDSTKLRVTILHIQAGNYESAKLLLATIHHKSLYIYKILLIILSKIPQKYLGTVIKKYQKFQRILLLMK